MWSGRTGGKAPRSRRRERGRVEREEASAGGLSCRSASRARASSLVGVRRPDVRCGAEHGRGAEPLAHRRDRERLRASTDEVDRRDVELPGADPHQRSIVGERRRSVDGRAERAGAGQLFEPETPGPHGAAQRDHEDLAAGGDERQHCRLRQRRSGALDPVRVEHGDLLDGRDDHAAVIEGQWRGPGPVGTSEAAAPRDRAASDRVGVAGGVDEDDGPVGEKGRGSWLSGAGGNVKLFAPVARDGDHFAALAHDDRGAVLVDEGGALDEGAERGAPLALQRGGRCEAEGRATGSARLSTRSVRRRLPRGAPDEEQPRALDDHAIALARRGRRPPRRAAATSAAGARGRRAVGRGDRTTNSPPTTGTVCPAGVRNGRATSPYAASDSPWERARSRPTMTRARHGPFAHPR